MKKLYSFNVDDIVDDMHVIELIIPPKGSYKSIKYKTKCVKCGREKIMTGPCLAKRIGTTHSACGKGMKMLDKRFYQHWCAMRTRTTNPNQSHWKDYGGRGINSNAFENFVDFYDTMYSSYKDACCQFGEKYVSLERVDVDGNYCKENCIWINRSQQKGNQRRTVYFVIEFPDGHKEVHRNCRQFAKNHELNANCISDLVNGRLKTYKGLKGYRIKRESVTTKGGVLTLREE